jgi:N-carbamoylputrescine amidase
MARNVTFAAAQMSCGSEVEVNVAKAERLVRAAAERGADVVLLQELFETPYFPIDQDSRRFDLARPLAGHPTIDRIRRLARELGVVVPVSFFERANHAFFNSVAVVDADGAVLGVYRKTHLPQAPAYQEKYYFNPGDTGPRVWRTRYGVLGVGICWDQWFPEAARCMALMGAEALLYPTAIGSDPPGSDADSLGAWQRVQQDHAAANFMPLIAANRVGTETGERASIRFYGSSFVADHTGALLAQASENAEEVVTATVDLDETRAYRERWSIFRDRRPDTYGTLLTLDAETVASAQAAPQPGS